MENDYEFMTSPNTSFKSGFDLKRHVQYGAYFFKWRKTPK